MKFAILAATGMALMTTPANAQRRTLDQGGWAPEVKARLEALVAQGAGRGAKVVFDLDNTLLCRDIGEATFAAMIEAGALVPSKAPSGISPAFRVDGREVDAARVEDLALYYEAFLSATTHQPGEREPYASGYGWIVQVMAGKSAAEVVEFTAKAYDGGAGSRDAADPAGGETEIHGYRRPFFYPEMVDLVALLFENGYDVHVVSASNAWSVRWMVTRVLDPMVAARAGTPLGIPARNVIGISVLLSDPRTGRLEKDSLLVRSNEPYAALEPDELARHVLTTSLISPLPAYHGKVAAILAAISPDRPWLVAGDSPNDHAMLDWAEHRLWIARLEKPSYQRETVERIGGSRAGEWLVQPVLAEKRPGFVASREDLARRLPGEGARKAEESVRTLAEAGALRGFE